MTAHTFLVTHMKEKLFDNDTHKDRIITARKHKPDLEYYGPLRRLSRLMLWSVGLSLLTSVLQISVGLYPSNWSAGICLVAAAFAFILMVANVYLIACNLRTWFDDLEDQKKNINKNESGPEK